MITRTEEYGPDNLLPGIQAMEAAGWSVKQIVPMPLATLVVFERGSDE